MKREDIQVGKTYSNHTHPAIFRQVVDEGPHLLTYSGQIDGDCVAYRSYQWSGRTGTYRAAEKRKTCTRASLATWAAREATADELTMLSRVEEFKTGG